QFAQWTIVSVPGPPVLNRMIARMRTSEKDLARRCGVDETDFRPKNFEVLTLPASLGRPGVRVCTISQSYLERPTVCSDVLISPIGGLGTG
ncbi:hypothetical protein LY76DRAFT_529028, partial [Colletotrichum caudatum]